MNKTFLFLLLTTQVFGQNFTKTEIVRYQNQAQNVTIIRDTWGIPHVYGKTDADAVFGIMYAQCEDDFNRIEMNYIEKLGRLSEIKGDKYLYNDLQIRLMIDSVEAIADYNKAQPWLKKLLIAHADGINFYLHKNPNIKPQIIKKFKPWYPLLWTDGSIGAISTADISIAELKDFYSKSWLGANYKANDISKLAGISSNLAPKQLIIKEPTGSNGFAISPKITENGKAILYINPHVTFYFRPEVQMVSGEGLNSYGAITWGQFFVYQGFNEKCGWMHTSSNVDVADTFAEKITTKNGKYFYEYDKILKPVLEKDIKINFLEEGLLKTKNFKAFYTNHGPIMAMREGKWVSLKSFNRSVTSLIQSWKRTKATGFDDYKKIMALKGNTSNNTVFADNQGNIAYWHGNFVPIRDKNLDWGKDVDGSTSKTNWKGLHAIDETVHSYNPPNGWLQNCNSTPFTVAGSFSPKQKDYPNYMAPDGENFRGINAVRVLGQEKKYTIDKVIQAGYDNYLAAFEVLVPALIKKFDKEISAKDSLYSPLIGPINELRNWDFRSTETSVAATLAIEWAYNLNPVIQKLYIDEGEADQVAVTKAFADSCKAEAMLLPFYKTVMELKQNFGSWQVAWGQINRYQRVSNEIDQKFDDALKSYPVGYASALWGGLPSYNSKHFAGQKLRYGVGGNSFVCAVEFGEKVKAKSILAGGNSGNPNSKHFTDQLEMYTKGQFKDVLFYKEDVLKNMERSYQPGE
jgi:acyl-homoserine-lactone acylase